ncbi:hypothetical protein Ahy_A07g031625 isoform D [Arachis hypogaea]|uniref:Uncharacterized protein n=1 Tax=Arachis hypogaea TaxID=3818 RepID=A0A445C4P2_ARAHY|nr:hypothetical protein Ahy_A07g031625 isoform D [Arachis hypogaea]
MKKNMKKKHFHFHLFLFITLLLFLTPRIHAIRRNKFSTPSTSSSSSRQQGFHPWKNNNNSPTEFDSEKRRISEAINYICNVIK